mgnify:FL=1
MITREHLYEIIFEADTKKGKIFDIGLIILIAFSIMLVMFDSMESISSIYHRQMRIAEWVITIIFTIEYALRIYIVKKPQQYIFSLYGIIDLLAILPTYVGLILVGGQSLMVIRAIRLLKIGRAHV